MSENDDIPSVKELGKKIQAAKEKSVQSKLEKVKKAKSGMNLTIELLAGVFAGLLVGYYLDKWLGTKPIFFIICFVFGFLGAVKNIIRQVGETKEG